MRAFKIMLLSLIVSATAVVSSLQADDGVTSEVGDFWKSHREAFVSLDIKTYMDHFHPEAIFFHFWDQKSADNLEKARVFWRDNFDDWQKESYRVTEQRRYSERFYDNEEGFESGIAYFVSLTKTGEMDSYYYSFEYFLKKSDGEWKILIEKINGLADATEWEKLPSMP